MRGRKLAREKALAELDRNGMLITLYFAASRGEVKLVRAIRGALWDVIVDLRAGSPTTSNGSGPNWLTTTARCYTSRAGSDTGSSRYTIPTWSR
jgi:hypothetical protein